MSTHTPTPWALDIPLNDGAFGISAIDPKDGELFCVADVYGIDYQNDTSCATAKANAAFIVKAVNEHEAMVAALINIKYSLEKISCTDYPVSEEMDMVNAVLSRVRTA